ncbi:hypothetical protein FRC08_014681, partial [Ceratobasidium sp. 394]
MKTARTREIPNPITRASTGHDGALTLVDPPLHLHAQPSPPPELIPPIHHRQHQHNPTRISHVPPHSHSRFRRSRRQPRDGASSAR